MKRSGKFYRNNEKEVMKMLGFEPTKNSGSGWIEKEDGQSEEMICQLKSTDAGSIKVNKRDIDVLELNASVSHKLPVFAIQFLQSNDVFLVVRPDVLLEISNYIKTGERPSLNLGIEIGTEQKPQKRKMIKSSSKLRIKYKEENEKKYRKEKSAI